MTDTPVRIAVRLLGKLVRRVSEPDGPYRLAISVDAQGNVELLGQPGTTPANLLVVEDEGMER